jgi:hypothetical protein
VRNVYVASIVHPDGIGGKIYEIARFGGATVDDDDPAWASKHPWNRWCAANVIALSRAVSAVTANSRPNPYALAAP